MQSVRLDNMCSFRLVILIRVGHVSVWSRKPGFIRVVEMQFEDIARDLERSRGLFRSRRHPLPPKVVSDEIVKTAGLNQYLTHGISHFGRNEILHGGVEIPGRQSSLPKTGEKSSFHLPHIPHIF